MRILVFSDCHGDVASAMAAIEAQPTAKTILFLGDGIGDIEMLTDQYHNKDFYLVRGNGDFASRQPTTRLLEFSGKRIWMTHGHEYHVKLGLQNAVDTARHNQCDLLLYGHTHIPYTTFENGLYIFNPGSIARRNSHTYGVIDITPAGIVCNIISLA